MTSEQQVTSRPTASRSPGFRQDEETGLFWAVTVPNEQGPFQSLDEAEKWFMEDQDAA